MHWFSILNSMMVVVVMSCIVAMIMMRTIRKDLAQYESLIVDSGGASVSAPRHAGPLLWPRLDACTSIQDANTAAPAGIHSIEARAHCCLPSAAGQQTDMGCLVSGTGQQAEIEESGWKMVSGDVFRTPKDPLLLCVEVGSGVQICASAFITLLFAALGEQELLRPCVQYAAASCAQVCVSSVRLSEPGTLCQHGRQLAQPSSLPAFFTWPWPPTAGFLSPASRGALLTALLVMYLLLAIAAGYASVYIWGMINRSYEGWYNVCWRVSCYFPGITLGTRAAAPSMPACTPASASCG